MMRQLRHKDKHMSKLASLVKTRMSTFLTFLTIRFRSNTSRKCIVMAANVCYRHVVASVPDSFRLINRIMVCFTRLNFTSSRSQPYFFHDGLLFYHDGQHSLYIDDHSL
ncbi:hypothetical protein H106_01372 [Trichophyton rubrum CBS 735.88]|nr:hypothetical protein H106_01372 [Trichophyton rubrum CBS 735.88]